MVVLIPIYKVWSLSRILKTTMLILDCRTPYFAEHGDICGTSVHVPSDGSGMETEYTADI